MTRRSTICLTAIALTLAAGCGTQPGVGAPPTTVEPAPTGPLVLAQFDRGVGAVPEGSDDPQWADPSAVAALDGSAVFSIRRSTAGDEQLARLDPKTGDVTASWPLPAGMVSIGAVAPDGTRIALIDADPKYTERAPRPKTRLAVFNTAMGAETRRLDLTGDVIPEAFSIDGRFLFVLENRGDHYGVQTLDLVTSDRYDTNTRDKDVLREVMYGTAVRGVLSADGTLLATLYRNPNGKGEPAFVHVLDLKNAWAYCADLVPPFGTGPEGSDRIELTSSGTVLVTALNAGRVAEIHIEEVHTPTSDPVTIRYRDETVTPSTSELGGPSGYGYVIATLR
jgi:hypothetical protein